MRGEPRLGKAHSQVPSHGDDAGSLLRKTRGDTPVQRLKARVNGPGVEYARSPAMREIGASVSERRRTAMARRTSSRIAENDVPS